MVHFWQMVSNWSLACLRESMEGCLDEWRVTSASDVRPTVSGREGSRRMQSGTFHIAVLVLPPSSFRFLVPILSSWSCISYTGCLSLLH